MPSQHGPPGVRADRSADFGVFNSPVTMWGDEKELGTHLGGTAVIGPTAPQGMRACASPMPMQLLAVVWPQVHCCDQWTIEALTQRRIPDSQFGDVWDLPLARSNVPRVRRSPIASRTRQHGLDLFPLLTVLIETI